MTAGMSPEELGAALRQLWDEYEAARQVGKPTDVIAAKIHALVASVSRAPAEPSTHGEPQQGAQNEQA